MNISDKFCLAKPHTQQTRILILDDDLSTIEFLYLFTAEMLGYKDICCLTDAKRALDILSGQQCYPVLILNYIMPQLSGLTLLKRLVEQVHQPYSVIMLTGHGRDISVINEFYSQSCPWIIPVAILEKPFSQPLLSHALEAAIRSNNERSTYLQHVAYKLDTKYIQHKTLYTSDYLPHDDPIERYSSYSSFRHAYASLKASLANDNILSGNPIHCTECQSSYHPVFSILCGRQCPSCFSSQTYRNSEKCDICREEICVSR